VAPTRIAGTIGISKAYITRVGGGPFPSEALDAKGEHIRKRGNEFGSVTGRPRRCGWFDAPLLRYSAMINGFDTLVMTKLDVLDDLDQIPVCVEYKLDGKVLNSMPSTTRELDHIQAVYEYLPGWQKSTKGIGDFEKLPAKAREYVEFLEKLTGVEVGCISTGPERTETIVRPDTRFAKLTT
jgi:adenylosuccinate synthase